MEQKTEATFEFSGFLMGHNGQVTSIACGSTTGDEDTVLVSGSRDKTLIIWDLTTRLQENHYGEPFKALTGHSHFVTDLTLSSDKSYLISSSWDKSLRLWDVRYARCLERFVGHNKEVHSVTFSSDNRQIFSGGSEKNLFIWNTLGQCKVKSEHNNHLGWVSKVRYSQSRKNDYYASVGRDGRLKIWSGIFKLYASIKAHDNYINALAISTNGQYIATGGKDQNIRIWDYNDLSKPYQDLKTDSEVHALDFNTHFMWVAAATDNKIKVYDIMKKEELCVLSQDPEMPEEADEHTPKPRCTSIKWSSNSKKLYVGCSDGHIRVYDVIIS